MKWFYVVEDHLNKQTANRTHVTEFCHALAKIDEVILFSQTDASTFSFSDQYNCLQIMPIHIRPHYLGDILNTIRAFFYLRRQIKTSKPNVFYIRATGFGIGPLIAARINKIPVVLEVNGNWKDEHRFAITHYAVPKKYFVALINSLRGFSLNIACRIARYIVVVTPNIANFLIQNRISDSEKILVVQNGVNIDLFRPLDKISCKESLGLQPDYDYIGFIGTLSAWQGVEDLIMAYADLNKKLTRKIYLLIVGDGPEYRRCNEMSEKLMLGNSVIFTGAQPYSSIPQYMGACSVLVAPKKPIACSPLKIYEYMACGRPIIASDIEDLQFIEKQGVGILFSPGDVIDLASKLQKLLELPDDRKDLIGERARQFVEANHSWDAVVQTVRNFVITRCGGFFIRG